jgi:peroxiredoxin
MRCRWHATAALAVAVLLAAAGAPPCSAQNTKRFMSVVAGGPAPDYRARTLAGDSLRLADFRGDMVLLNVWATWCVPCRVELPQLQQLHDQYGDRGLHVIGISLDRMSDGGIRRFLRLHEITYTNVKDREPRLTAMFGFQRAVPQTMLIDQEGTVIGYWLGAIGEERRQFIERRLNFLLPATDSAGSR